MKDEYLLEEIGVDTDIHGLPKRYVDPPSPIKPTGYRLDTWQLAALRGKTAGWRPPAIFRGWAGRASKRGAQSPSTYKTVRMLSKQVI